MTGNKESTITSNNGVSSDIAGLTGLIYVENLGTTSGDSGGVLYYKPSSSTGAVLGILHGGSSLFIPSLKILNSLGVTLY